MPSRLHEIVETGPQLSPTTKASYRRTLDDWLVYAGPDPQAWTAQRAQDYYVSLLSRVAVATANKMLSALRYAARHYAALANDPQLDFAKAIEPQVSRESKSTEKALTEGQIAAVLEATTGTRPVNLRDRAVVALAIGTGMRRASLATLRISPFEIDMPGQHVYVDAIVKGGRTWKVPIAPSVLAACQPYMRWLAQHRVETGVFFRRINKSLNGHKPAHGLAADGWALWSIIEDIGSRVGIAVHPHVFRHTLVTWLRDRGVSPLLITALTGQRDRGLDGLPVLTQDVDYSLWRSRAAEAVDEILRPLLT